MSERVHERERAGPSCATCQSPLRDGPPAICSACRATHHALCVSEARRCTCGASIFVPTSRAVATHSDVGTVLRTFAKRELWTWLLPVPFWTVSAWVLATSERVWTETILVGSARGGTQLMSVGAVCRLRLIMGLLFFAIVPGLVTWRLTRHQADHAAASDAPPATWVRVVEWAVRLGALAWIGWVTHHVWTYR